MIIGLTLYIIGLAAIVVAIEVGERLDTRADELMARYHQQVNGGSCKRG